MKMINNYLLTREVVEEVSPLIDLQITENFKELKVIYSSNPEIQKGSNVVVLSTAGKETDLGEVVYTVINYSEIIYIK